MVLLFNSSNLFELGGLKFEAQDALNFEIGYFPSLEIEGKTSYVPGPGNFPFGVKFKFVFGLIVNFMLLKAGLKS